MDLPGSSGSGNGSTGQTAPVSPVAALVNVAPNPVDEGTPVTVTANLPELVTAGSPVEKTVTIPGTTTSSGEASVVFPNAPARLRGNRPAGR